LCCINKYIRFDAAVERARRRVKIRSGKLSLREFPSFMVYFKVCARVHACERAARMHAHSVNYIVISYTTHSYADVGRCNVCGIELPFVYSLSLIISGGEKMCIRWATDRRGQFSCRFTEFVPANQHFFSFFHYLM